MINGATAAKQLFKTIGAPDWAVSVWTETKADNDIRLAVYIDPDYDLDPNAIPKSFKGYEVVVSISYAAEAL